MAKHNVTGKEGEALAIQHLREKGYTILETNWRFGKLEVDVIASLKGILVVAEVKTRSSTVFGEPEVFVTRKKQSYLVKAAHAYVTGKELDVEVRFDIVSIVTGNGGKAINHIEGAFYALVK